MQAHGPRNSRTRNMILQYISSFASRQGRQPSVREIGEAAGLMSTSTTAGYLHRMVREGLLTEHDQARRKYSVSAVGLAMLEKAG